MASPFSVFRKNQKLMMALLTVLVMIGFVFLPLILDAMGSRTVVNNVVIKTDKYGDLTEQDLHRLQTSRHAMLNILTELGQLTKVHPAIARQRAEYVLGPASEASVVTTWLMTEYALNEMGMDVSDTAINNFLKAWTRDMVTPNDFKTVFRQSGISELQFFDLLRRDLATLKADQLLRVSVEGLTPAQRWQCFCRIKKTASIEVVPVDVAQFLDKVEPPNDKELQASFDQYKDKLPSPYSPDPGFKTPQKVALQYFKANLDGFISKVTDEEVLARYNSNKAKYEEDEGKGKAKPEDTKSDNPADGAKAGDTAAQDANPKETPAADGEKKTEDLADATKTRIRREIASERIRKAFETLSVPLDHFGREWRQYKPEKIRLEAKSKSGDKIESKIVPPSRPDFEALAKEQGLEVGRTELISQWQAQTTEIGAALAGGRDPVWQLAFKSLPEFRAEMAMSLEDAYLFWKTDETKENVPKLTDEGVKDQVVRAWKMKKAADMALKRAEELAAQAAKDKQPLKKIFADRPDMPVIEPQPFSWLTFGNVPIGSAPNAIRMSKVNGIEYAGTDFMRTVFGLTPGQVGAALNMPKNTAYVIQLNEFSPSEDVLWEQFTVDDFSKYAPAAREENLEIGRAWLEEIKSDAGYKMLRSRDLDAEMESDSESD